MAKDTSRETQLDPRASEDDSRKPLVEATATTITTFEGDQELGGPLTAQQALLAHAHSLSRFDVGSPSLASREQELSRKEVDPLPTTVDLPQNIYGATMMAIFRSSQNSTTTVYGLTGCVFIGLLLNTGMQFYILYCTKKYICFPSVQYTRKLYAEFQELAFDENHILLDNWQEMFDKADELCQLPLSQPFFYTSILVIWTATCWIDLAESLHFLRRIWSLDNPQNRARTVGCLHTDEHIIVTELSRWSKAIISSTVFAPKILVLIYLWWLGARWLTSTLSFQDMLLNAVALAFITEMDELVYLVMIPDDIQALVGLYKLKRQAAVDLLKAIDDGDHKLVSELRDRKFRFRIMTMLASLAFVTLLPTAYIHYLQHVLPDYKWDVHGPCELRVSEMLGQSSFFGA
mmetsp:Transcript_23334/g.51279  ORF Transcript_23334/g.51279 Transcript_23334/m.51279 type:complete len:404 (+) Transcript_23334:261-1472(+)|eukprot:CAMPEP_0206457690 /NCGR_PEP_ID=MMETSP0324_2-20121206/23117_1 /ASSEMBLY_ACC=CAM_ASM_000836 /TAXON_ID=2866 /ORGANISM="Crypthecodinium cohnii, Strain Seligo" /LENGTH=403 /DNA_ID=CAMNT_0053928871 /DNA_START=190 /DNA_END=1401 /DNA_ORIENTATION=-